MTRWSSDDGAASEIVGTLLLVAIMVAAFGVLAMMLFLIGGPDAEVHADVQVATHPGSSGWGTGDETVRVAHRGGQAIAMEITTVRVTIDGDTTELSGAALADAFSDGRLTIGETWRHTATIDSSSEVAVQVIVETGGSRLLFSGPVAVGSGLQGLFCGSDTSAPTIQSRTQDPTDVDVSHTGPVDVTVTLADDCHGVDTDVTPHLWHRVNGGADPAYTDEGAMSHAGGTTWTGQIPARAWSLRLNDDLQYYFSPAADNGGNSGQTAVQTDTIGLVTTYSYVDSHTAHNGTVSDFGAAKSAFDGGDAARLTEAGTLVASTPTEPREGSATSDSGVDSPDRVLVSDDARAILDTTGEQVEVTGFSLPASTTSVQKVLIGFEGRKHQSGGLDPSVTLRYDIGGAPGGTMLDQSLSNSVDQPFVQDVTADRAWTAADIADLNLRLTASLVTNRHAEVDHMFLIVTYTKEETIHILDVEMAFDGGLPPLLNDHALQLRYKTAGDSYDVQVHDGTAWNTRGDALSSAGLADWSYVLTPAEHQAGSPQIRFVDRTDSADQGTLDLDYVRVATT